MRFKELILPLKIEEEELVEKFYEEGFFNFAIEEDKKGKKVLKIYLREGEPLPDFLKDWEIVDEKITTPKDWIVELEPFEIVEGIFIDPTEKINRRDAIVIKLSPGVAFGTGLHPTTRMSVFFLKKYLKEGNTVLDVGCGTGILAIAAKKLGASRVVAVDVDEQAVEVAEENVRKNDVDVLVKWSDLLSEVEGTFDIVVSNILAEIHVKLLEDVNRVTHRDSMLILSGIVDRKEDMVKRKASEHGWNVLERKQEREWVTLVMKRS
ncbi:ribosomal protein L11 methyltransferase [Thermotoga maritima MSB8]|uniref:Ribosomal protein L11 methyltransferase n=1 Tax=Thermotoga maritima (strain ATCC 43589 / DSM 3109 / JCM 10099 / NBRC 100826 / MSB8) TaxID=243274 RepID=PRMA_THEMA|nr:MULTISPECIES: 50S ribosomal protein L11 methyltransferase [Thermotoga]Q9X0G8.1 RecName: Full=Ribosomal protein L11 methyltransferase; Short=L11 Mtase [Thermotoga maritima MSB8]AAD36156.1 ribosomal protein L11 methyltransferase, putative [Thermotoga maritima MSB8]AGL50007.1 Ribosomal protein L11 methyltransferase [Thermotoga maritima MSB8]AHD19013.1 ribosomal protein L11 methyltransferase [Thermotoga maritima MSB8]AIY87242.1 ribosomal protein L11 methyltransferase [Thermotoga sp. 2812B]AKE2